MCSVLPPEIVTHDAYIGGHFWQMKITRKASDVTENLQLYRVVRFFCPRLLCTMMHLMSFCERTPIYASCMTISGGRTEHVIIGFGELSAVD